MPKEDKNKVSQCRLLMSASTTLKTVPQHPPKFKKDSKLWLTRVPHQGSIQVIVQEKKATTVSGTGGWEYKLKDPDTNIPIPGWFAQNLLKRSG